MKNIKIFRLSLWLCVVLFLSACSKDALDKVNHNPNNPEDVPAKFLVTDLITSTAFNIVGGEISLYATLYVEHETGVWNQQYNAEIRLGEPTSSTTYNNVWGQIYNNIKALKIVIAKTSQGGSEENNHVTNGIAKVLMAYNLGVLTDYWGDVPFSESGILKPDGSPAHLQPKIDKQSELYPMILAYLDDAIVQLDKSDASPIGNQDLIYGGKSSLWKKAAYGLKARYTMRTLFRSANKPGDLNSIITNVDKSFASAAEQMKFDVYDGGALTNPLGAFSNSRDGFGASKSLLTKFKALNDPRGVQSFMNYDFEQLTLEQALAGSAPNGSPVQQQYVYDISIPEYSKTAPTLLLSYHELLFLKAEALVRLNRLNDAKPVLEDAVVAAFANLQRTLKATNNDWGIGATIDLSTGVAENYFKNDVSPMFATDALKAVMLQKYLAFFGASGESTEMYNDIRRLRALGEGNLIKLENPFNTDKFPLRYTYGNSDVLANPVVAAAYGNGQYVYTDKVWWAGGN
ncbi:MAG: SusD/RagB family nutrient-binding outer membrane lipoprotein [Ginsengibacter sp.]